MDFQKMAEGVYAAVRKHVSDALAPIIERIKAIEGRPPPANGADGASVTVDDVLPSLMDAVKALHVPTPKDGASVTVDDVRPLFDLAFAGWALDFERRAQDIFQRSIESMPKPADGKDGRDALPVESFDMVMGDDGRTVTASLQIGETVVQKSVMLPTVLDRGVYREGQSYEKGDAVSWGGSLWIAQTQTQDKPESSDGWRLAVKRGRDGKAGSSGDRGPPGPRGKSYGEVS